MNTWQLFILKNKYVIVTIVILLGLLMRLYGINLPLTESHQVRQSQTAMMTRNLYEDGMNIFRTRLDVFGENPGYVILEFPLMHTITASLYYFFGVHEVIGRLVNVAFSMGAMLLMYGLAREFLSRVGALAALSLYVFSPMNIFFSRAFMPESSMMFFAVGAIYFFLKWLDKQTLILYLTAIIFAALSGLIKPTTGVIFVPIFAAWFLKYGCRVFRRLDFWLYILLSTMPLIFWSAYANYFNSQISYQTFSYMDSWLEVLRTRGTIRHWISPRFYTFVGGSVILLLLTPLGFIGATTGVLLIGAGDKRKILYSWLGAMIVYFYALAGPISGHIYYNLHLLPISVILFGFSVEWLLNKQEFFKKIFNRKITLSFMISFVIFTLIGYGVGYFKFFNYMYSNRMPYVLEISEIIKKNSSKSSFIIDNESGLITVVISYYSHRKAYPFAVNLNAIKEFEDLRKRGAEIFVTMESNYSNYIPVTKDNEEFWNYLNECYKPIAITDHYHIFDVSVKKKE